MSRRDELLARLDDVVDGRWSTWNMFAHDQERGLERAAWCDAQQAVLLAAAAGAYPATKTVDVVFDGPPGPESGSFIEVEDQTGASIRVGQWIERDDGYWVLRLDIADV
jgi:hypothetical protein